MISGDRNTSFFHVSTIVRRRRNRISYLRNSVGEWIHEETEIMSFIREGFAKLYTTSHLEAKLQPGPISPWQAALTDMERDSLYDPVSVEEIKSALWSIKAFKAPGPDGLHAGFFQRFWMIVGGSVVEEIKKCFVTKKILEFLNKTNVALIPKIHGPETIGNYRPISLCNTVYKMITKIIVARLRPMLDKLVSPVQSAFVPGRKGVDNAIIVQEIIHSISKKKGRVGYTAIKVDLEKAYDKLEWSFIRELF